MDLLLAGVLKSLAAHGIILLTRLGVREVLTLTRTGRGLCGQGNASHPVWRRALDARCSAARPSDPPSAVRRDSWVGRTRFSQRDEAHC